MAVEMTARPLMTIPETAAYLGKPVSTVYAWAKSGELPAAVCVCQSGTAHFDHREWPTPGFVLTALLGGRVVGRRPCLGQA